MSFQDLVKNFGHVAPPQTQFDRVDESTRCGACGGKHLWRWRKLWFCAKCRIPPDAKFIEEEFGGTGMLPRQPANLPSRLPDGTRLVASECHWSREVCCKTEGCMCRMVSETAFTDGSSVLLCFMCGAVAISDFDL